jgi:hypothetical protein
VEPHLSRHSLEVFDALRLHLPMQGRSENA